MLVRAHEAGLRRYTRRLAGDEGEDIAQEAFVAAWRALGQWRGDGSFAGWLRSIATRRYLDRRRRVVSRPVEAGAAGLTAVDDRAGDTADDRIAIEQALNALPPREKAAALLVFQDGFSHVETAAILGLPLGTLKSVVARARTALIPLLAGVGE